MKALLALSGHDIDRELAAAAARILDPTRDQIVAFHVVHPKELELTVDPARIGAIGGRAADGVVVSRRLSEPALAEDTVQAVQRIEDEFRDHVAELREHYLGDFDVEIEVKVARDPAAAILEGVSTREVGGLVMGTRSHRSRLGRALLGSCAEAVMRGIEVPLLIVKEGSVAPTIG